MSNPNNLFDKVDGVESKVENVSTKVDALTKKVELLSTVQRTASSPRKAENPQLDLKRFIANGKREYCWMGTENEFQKEKKIILISIIVLIGVLIIASVFTSIACGLYTTFTLFEHIWLICICFIIKYIFKSDRYYKDTELALNSCFETNLSADGIYEIGQLKKRYKVFLGLSCVCSILNIV